MSVTNAICSCFEYNLFPVKLLSKICHELQAYKFGQKTSIQHNVHAHLGLYHEKVGSP